MPISTRAIALLSSLSIALVLSAPLSSSAQTVSNLREGMQTITVDRVLDELAQMNVVYLGETHNQAADHASQLAIIQQLYDRNPNLAIGLEMIQRPFQASLDQYLAGDISEAELREQTEYDQRWGYDWEYYAPILRFAQAHQLPVVALNTPTEITRRVAQKGLLGFQPEDDRWVPDIQDLDTSSVGYRQLLWDLYAQHSHGHSQGFENFFLAQVLWDETMAEAIAAFVSDRPDTVMVVLAGRGHIVYHYGIPSRVQRRLDDRPNVFQQRSLLLSDTPVGDEPAELTLPSGEPLPPMADYLWISE